jgi:hypothetical protein
MCFKIFSKDPDQKVEDLEKNASFDGKASFHSEDESLTSFKDLEAAYSSDVDSPTATASSSERSYVVLGTENQDKDKVRIPCRPPQHIIMYTGSLVPAVVPVKAARVLGFSLISPCHQPNGSITSPIPSEIPRKGGEVLGIPAELCLLEDKIQMRTVCDGLESSEEDKSALSEMETGKEELSH